ncbi:9186_t:CDS:2 [Ambispora gerdemannii]|uniref:9186_t:CDS:1 n=1 Tax=Ambispora gerdemannii TaxID=144530 RepID=A0A9N8W818_9GLOM|nr:9186_t:CDS:2 [Ambispora gerdemannii]
MADTPPKSNPERQPRHYQRVTAVCENLEYYARHMEPMLSTRDRTFGDDPSRETNTATNN